MRKKIFLSVVMLFSFGLIITSCGDTEEADVCSSELGDIGDAYSCNVPVMPQICTVDGVDDHWVLDGVEYSCDGDCTDIPTDLVNAIKAKDGCATKKIANLAEVNTEISKRAEIILADMRMESVLCSN